MNGFMELEVVESRAYLRESNDRYFSPISQWTWEISYLVITRITNIRN